MVVLFSLMGAAGLIAADQFIKHWAYTVLRVNGEMKLIDGVLHLLYSENTGAAFSILQGNTVFLSVVTSVVLMVLLWILLSGKVRGNTIVIALSLVIAGGGGNLIDRIVRGFVVDYIYFVPIDFPIFNLADCCVVIGTAIIVINLLLNDDEEKKKNGSILQPPEGENEDVEI